MKKLTLILCLTLFGAWLDWFWQSLPGYDKPDWPHLHHVSKELSRAQETEIVAQYLSVHGGDPDSITVAEIKAGHPPVRWPEGTYKLR